MSHVSRIWVMSRVSSCLSLVPNVSAHLMSWHQCLGRCLCLEKNVWTTSLALSIHVAFVTCCRRVQLLSRLEHSLKSVTLMVWLVQKWRPRPANAALLSVAPEPGTDYRQPFDCQNCRYLHSSASSRPTSSSTSVLVVAVSRIPPSGAVATVVSSAPIINVPTQFNSNSRAHCTIVRQVKRSYSLEECRRGAHLPLVSHWARRWINHWRLWRMVSVTPDLRLPSQP